MLSSILNWGRRTGPTKPAVPVAVAPRVEGNFVTELARVNDSICGMGANWAYASDFSRNLRTQAMRATLARLANADASDFPIPVDQLSLGHMRAAIIALLEGSYGPH